jgi:hypothetical protein
MVEDTVKDYVRESDRQGTNRERVLQKLHNRRILSSGWYEISSGIEMGEKVSLFSNDSTRYVEVSLKKDGFGPLSVAFPLENWLITPPKPEFVYNGKDWIKVEDPEPKLLRLEKREVDGYGMDRNSNSDMFAVETK